MSVPTASLINLSSHQVIIYMGIPIFIIGLIGGILNIIIFLSLKIFRENSCSFYLIIISFVNIGHLIFGLLSRIMISGFDMDWTISSIIYCKFRPYCTQFCILLSFTCMCLATIDQFLATCLKPRWQNLSNIKLVHNLTIYFIIIWLLHGIPHIIFYNHIKLNEINKYKCIITNKYFQIYYIGIQGIIYYGFLPILINTLFALLAYKNIQNLSYRTIPLVRRELDKQMTTIILIQAVYNIISTIPYLIINILILISIIKYNTDNSDKLEFANIITLCIFYLNFSSPFYMYMCVSQRFRQQFIYVFNKIHFKRCRQQLIIVNQVAPYK